MCWSCVFALESVILLMVQFSTMCSKTVLGYICQDKDLAVLSHVFPCFDVPCHLYDCTASVGIFNWAIGHASASTGVLMMTAQSVSTMFISVLFSFIRISQWANVFSLVLAPVCRHVRLDGPLCQFCECPSRSGQDHRAHLRPDWMLAFSRRKFFFQLESNLTHRESSRSVSLSTWDKFWTGQFLYLVV